MCEAKDSSTNQFICGKLKWYCHDPNAQNIVDMTGSVCSNAQSRFSHWVKIIQLIEMIQKFNKLLCNKIDFKP